jgi:putative ABC transport system substrate-binding protein
MAGFGPLPDLTTAIVQQQVDLIIAAGEVQTRAAMRATQTIPIIMVVPDPIGAGLVASLARPGGNGFRGKWIELLKEAVPEISRVAVLLNVPDLAHSLTLKELQAAAATLGVPLAVFNVREPAEFEGAFAAMTAEGASALIVNHQTLFNTNRVRIAALAVQSRLAMMYGTSAMVHVGGLMSCGVNYPALLRRVATYVDKILKGAKPGDLPVEQPTQFELVLNLRTAKVLGITMPPSLLLLADEVIQ